MTPEQFAYWLQGFAENNDEPPTEQQWKVIKDHLQTIFVKITPDRKEKSPLDLSGGRKLCSPPDITRIYC